MTSRTATIFYMRLENWLSFLRSVDRRYADQFVNVLFVSKFLSRIRLWLHWMGQCNRIDYSSYKFFQVYEFWFSDVSFVETCIHCDYNLNISTTNNNIAFYLSLQRLLCLRAVNPSKNGKSIFLWSRQYQTLHFPNQTIRPTSEHNSLLRGLSKRATARKPAGPRANQTQAVDAVRCVGFSRYPRMGYSSLF